MSVQPSYKHVMVNSTCHQKVWFQWVSNPVTDMYADSVVTVILRAERDPMPQKSKYLYTLVTRFQNKMPKTV